MSFEYKNIPEWTKEDEEVVNEIKDNGLWLFKYFIISMVIGVAIFILLELIDWWALNHLIGVFVR